MLLDLENVNDSSLTLSNPVLVNLHKVRCAVLRSVAVLRCVAACCAALCCAMVKLSQRMPNNLHKLSCTQCATMCCFAVPCSCAPCPTPLIDLHGHAVCQAAPRCPLLCRSVR